LTEQTGRIVAGLERRDLSGSPLCRFSLPAKYAIQARRLPLRNKPSIVMITQPFRGSPAIEGRHCGNR
jgi:hypothetical protein